MKTLIIVLSIVCIWGWVFYFKQPLPEKVIFVPEMQTIEIPVIVKEPQIIYQEIPQELRNFESENDLRIWILGHPIEVDGDCDDRAFEMIRLARLDGYDIHLQISGNHALCSTIIGNNIYFIEPQTGEYKYANYID